MGPSAQGAGIHRLNPAIRITAEEHLGPVWAQKAPLRGEGIVI